jgi:hypothetical protein
MFGSLARALDFVADVVLVAAGGAAVGIAVLAAVAWSLVVIPVALGAALAWKACRGARERLAARSAEIAA